MLSITQKAVYVCFSAAFFSDKNQKTRHFPPPTMDVYHDIGVLFGGKDERTIARMVSKATKEGYNPTESDVRQAIENAERKLELLKAYENEYYKGK